MKRKNESYKEITVSLSTKAQKCLHEYMKYTGQKSEAEAICRMILRLSDVLSNWHSETINNKTVSVSPKGIIFYGTPKEIRDILIDVSCRKILAIQLNFLHEDFINKCIDRKELYESSARQRREAIMRQDYMDEKDIIPKQRKFSKYNQTSIYNEKFENEFTTNPME